MVQPATRFAMVGEDRIAYQVLGEGPPDLVYFSGMTSNVDLRWEDPLQEHWFRRLASFSRVILFDKRGFGVSDPISDPGGAVFEQWADDVRAVMDASGSERAAIFGILDGGVSALLFAATYPERTVALMLGNTSARWVAAEGYPAGLSAETADAVTSTLVDLWGRDDAADSFFPSMAGDEDFGRRWGRFMRGSGRPRDVAAIMRAVIESDVRHVLPLISVPTLVLHRVEHPFVSVGQGRYLADHVPGARFVEVPGADGAFWTGDQDATLDIIQEFVTGAKPDVEIDRVLATVLFTDIVDSTDRAAALGDRRWKELLDAHDGIVRAEVDRYQGRLIKSTGDGALATFDGPARAVRCAVSTGAQLRGIGVEIRAGLHAGEIELRDQGDVGGIGVHIAARVMAEAAASEVLVSSTVKDLVVGSGLEFDERGMHSLKGVPGEWGLFAVRQPRA